MVKFGIARKYANDLKKFLYTLVENNIDVYEIGFAYSIPDKIPEDVVNLYKKYGVLLSCHLPFWINIGNLNYNKNINYLVKGLYIADQLQSVAVFHLGYYMNKRWNDIKYHARNIIKKALEISNVTFGKLGIETTGKQREIGTIDEIIELIKLVDDDRVVPVIDWAHIYARNNGLYPRTYNDFIEILEKFENELGYKPFHFHIGGIEYRKGNEVRHVTVKKMEPPIPYLFAALKDLNYNDIILIVETPTSIEDIKLLKEIWKEPESFYDMIPLQKHKSLLDFMGDMR